MSDGRSNYILTATIEESRDWSIDTSRTSNSVIVFQVPNEVGLGHMNRMACVASAVQELDPAVRIMFVVEGASHGLLECFSLPHISIPSTQLMRKSEAWSKFTVHETLSITVALSAALIEAMNPELVVFDCFPSLPFAIATKEKSIPSVMCIRNMKDFDSYAGERRVSLVLDSCKSIIVPHTLDESALPKAFHDRAVHVGPIVRPLPIDPTSVHARFSVTGKRVVVISAGGGGHRDTIEYLRLCLEAFELLQVRNRDAIAILIPGPLFKAWDRLPMISNLYVLPFDHYFLETCATADAVVAQAGYNSANELARLGTPTILVPAERGFDDQFGRAEQVASRCPHMHLLHSPTPTTLVATLEAILNKSIPRIRDREPDGSHFAAAHLLHLLGRL